jgi:hypothetical protein
MPESYDAPDVAFARLHGLEPSRTVALFPPRYALSGRLLDAALAFTQFARLFFKADDLG